MRIVVNGKALVIVSLSSRKFDVDERGVFQLTLSGCLQKLIWLPATAWRGRGLQWGAGSCLTVKSGHCKETNKLKHSNQETPEKGLIA